MCIAVRRLLTTWTSCIRSCPLYRADCMYDLGNYEDAIKLYDDAAFSYQNDPSSVSAYVQIVNAYFALENPRRPRQPTTSPNWMLQHMPAEAFQDAPFPCRKNIGTNGCNGPTTRECGEKMPGSSYVKR